MALMPSHQQSSANCRSKIKSQSQLLQGVHSVNILVHGHLVKQRISLAALCLPLTVGWSGMLANHLSNPALNCRTVPCMSLSSFGMRLKSLEPFTGKDASLALATAGGRLEGTWWTAASLPLLGCWENSRV